MAVEWTEAEEGRQLAKVRRAVRDLPEVTERPSHGSPAFFVRDKKCFVMFVADHHGDGRLSIWCAAPEGVQAEMIDTEPDRFFRPPYVGHRGWLGVHLREVPQSELDEISVDAFRVVAPKTVIKELDEDRPRS